MSSRAGFTLVEIVLALPILLIAVTMVTGTLIAMSKQRTVNQQNTLVADRVQSVVEQMRNEDFPKLFELYNAEDFDDPLGPGTAPGHRFRIDGLEPLPDTEGYVGFVLFPALNTGGEIDQKWELREDVPSRDFDTPRDLNGDSIVDDLDHSKDYTILPVLVLARWKGPFGPREFRLHTLLVDWSSAR